MGTLVTLRLLDFADVIKPKLRQDELQGRRINASFVIYPMNKVMEIWGTFNILKPYFLYDCQITPSYGENVYNAKVISVRLAPFDDITKSYIENSEPQTKKVQNIDNLSNEDLETLSSHSAYFLSILLSRSPLTNLMSINCPQLLSVKGSFEIIKKFRALDKGSYWTLLFSSTRDYIKACEKLTDYNYLRLVDNSEEEKVMYRIAERVEKVLLNNEYIEYQELFGFIKKETKCGMTVFNDIMQRLTRRDVFGKFPVSILLYRNPLIESIESSEMPNLNFCSALTESVHDVSANSQMIITPTSLLSDCSSIYQSLKTIYSRYKDTNYLSIFSSYDQIDDSEIFALEGLNEYQQDAVVAALSPKRHPFVFIRGLPGSGKTHIIDAIIKNYHRLSKKKPFNIAILTHYGKMVDNLQERLTESGSYSRHHDISSQGSVWDTNAQVSHRIMLTTIHSSIGSVNGSEYIEYQNKSYCHYTNCIDMVIIDECQNIPYSLMSPVLKQFKNAMKFVFIGDISQARPISRGMPYQVMSDVFGRSCFVLQDNYRMKSTPQSTNNMRRVSEGVGLLSDWIQYTRIEKVDELLNPTSDFFIMELPYEKDEEWSCRRFVKNSTISNQDRIHMPPHRTLAIENSSDPMQDTQESSFFYDMTSIMRDVSRSDELPFKEMSSMLDMNIRSNGTIIRDSLIIPQKDENQYENTLEGVVRYLYNNHDMMQIGCISPLNAVNQELNIAMGPIIKKIFIERFKLMSSQNSVTKKFGDKEYRITVGDKILFKKNYHQCVVKGVVSGPVKNNSSDWIVAMSGEVWTLASGKCVYLNKHIRLEDISLGYFTTVDSAMGSEYSHCLFYIPTKIQSIVGLFDRHKLLVALSRAKNMNIVIGHSLNVSTREMSTFFKNFSERLRPGQESVSIDPIFLMELNFQDKGEDCDKTLLKKMLQ